jgi:hypothetical protein
MVDKIKHGLAERKKRHTKRKMVKRETFAERRICLAAK